MAAPVLDLDAIRQGGKPALARALAAIETGDGSDAVASLLDAAVADPRGHVLGLTGPPGVGKSTLTDTLLKRWRKAGESVGVIAVDPSSRISQGALLGDRTRLKTDPEDTNVFVRSMAARDRLGGLSDHAVGAAALMRAVFDRVIVESVGIGQSEADIALVADTILLCIQPGSGDSLQFMKAGVMELPDVVAVTKADMDQAARRAVADVEGALTLALGEDASWKAPVVAVSAATGTGLDGLSDALDSHRAHLSSAGHLATRRARQNRQWLDQALKSRFGTVGAKLVTKVDLPDAEARPFAAIKTASDALKAALASL
ncbi:LAO/AO transport system kinase [Rhodobium orientis]|uniref:Methylmalonyl Co-A mutase-associated GTPase MeaB n=1 Tax=Rhodobium orientis TaxID=34017 RepID=A0A327JLX2_9HYPH|nr:methylmalonyl Co-A mutase-associated GTPase MeaB [Rhodobium orientis]MBB4305484.1 LAO/AO transport system kinase [Rhodobium orientis]MBK5949876.1 methylmalonyl Co-A mutase-associated GTPase MeaB [Rhodobium orientis]RAI24123.1 methylmalonyl Co-A mutase-associated GTPase MeaB [Rhodobium orientis]